MALWQPVLEPEHLRRLALELAPAAELGPDHPGLVELEFREQG